MARSQTTIVPTAGLEVAPFGILSPATTVYDESDSFWTSGFTYEAMDSGVVVVNASINGGNRADQVTVIDNTGSAEHWKTYYPFDIQASVKVSTMGTSPEAIQVGAQRALDIVTQKAVEVEFWNGEVAQSLTSSNDNRYLASSATEDVTPTPGTAVKVRYGLALLEQAIADSSVGHQGVIHTSRDAAVALRLKADGKTLRTNVGTPVVAGVGYSKKGPDGTEAAAGTAWMYATGPVSVRLGPTFVTPGKLNQAVDSRTNTIEYFVDRPAAVTWATTGAYAVLVDLTLDYK